jgi:hypothetical protein
MAIALEKNICSIDMKRKINYTTYDVTHFLQILYSWFLNLSKKEGIDKGGKLGRREGIGN